jgi:hypothetical protein
VDVAEGGAPDCDADAVNAPQPGAADGAAELPLMGSCEHGSCLHDTHIKPAIA